MKKNSILLLLLVVFTTSCKKEMQSLPAENNLLTSAAPALSAAVPCTGNTWYLTPGFPFAPGPGGIGYLGLRFIVNNKIYVPVYGQKIYIYDGSSWTWINSATPNEDNFSYAYCFSVGDKGYLVINDGGPKRLWQYTPATNSWAEKTPFAGPKRLHPTTFVIGTKAYVTCGFYNDNYFKDLWEYNTITDEWTQKASMPASIAGRNKPTAFSIGYNGYVVGGTSGGPFYGYPTIYYNHLLRYNQTFNSWTVMANYPGILGDDASSFAVGDYGYAGLDRHTFYRYAPATNTWLAIAAYPGEEYRFNYGMACNNKGYLFSSFDLYRYTPQVCGVGGTTP